MGRFLVSLIGDYLHREEAGHLMELVWVAHFAFSDGYWIESRGKQMDAASCSSLGHSGPSATEIVALFLDVVAAEVVNQSSVVMFSLIIVLLSI